MDLSKLTDQQLGVALKVIDSATKHGLNPDFVLPMVMIESGFDPKAKSPAGAVGPMQLTPIAAKDLKVADPTDVDQNIDGGMRLLKRLVQNEKFGGDPEKILAAYNAGPNHKFFESGDVKDLPDETVKHVVKVFNLYGDQAPPMTITEQAAEAPVQAGQDNQQEVFGGDKVEDKRQMAGQVYEDAVSRLNAGILGGAAGLGIGTAIETVPLAWQAIKAVKNLGASPSEAEKAIAESMAAPEGPTPAQRLAVRGAPGSQVQSVMRQPIPSGGPDAGRMAAGQTGVMPYNYAKAAGLTDIEAGLALDMSKEEGGVHDLLTKRREALNRISRMGSDRFVENPRFGGLLTPEQSVGSGPRASFVYKQPEAPTPEAPAGRPGGLSQLPPRQPVTSALPAPLDPAGRLPVPKVLGPLEKFGKATSAVLSSIPIKTGLSGLTLGQGAQDVMNRIKNKNFGEATASALSTGLGTFAPWVGAGANVMMLPVTAGIPLYLAAGDRLKYLQQHPEAYQVEEQSYDPMTGIRIR